MGDVRVCFCFTTPQLSRREPFTFYPDQARLERMPRSLCFGTPLLESRSCPQDEKTTAEGEDRQVSQGVQPVEDSLTILWDVVSALHDGGWHEDDMPRAILRLWKTSTIEPRLSNLSSLSLPEDFVTADTIPVELTSMGPCEIASSPGVDVGTTRCAKARAASVPFCLFCHDTLPSALRFNTFFCALVHGLLRFFPVQ